eukprot:CAMPEP_0181387584 /NCGR_PEP_ID=MMETSP1106-20121128/23804_1 /TAXON_ID=81844 /ORGANISM="Mantoniella antarctica, Strain SL-175" /LENGTH=376 /DNA_ID=CAMNT_0023507987 /DNA_START=468 /DNA_END=1598 /DNA_ORIENTATION=+
MPQNGLLPSPSPPPSPPPPSPSPPPPSPPPPPPPSLPAPSPLPTLSPPPPSPPPSPSPPPPSPTHAIVTKRDVRQQQQQSTLQAILRTKALEEPNAMKGDCISGLDVSFSTRNDKVMADIMRRLRERKPWGWIRFADGDINDLLDIVPGSTSTGQRLMDAIATWHELDNLVVSVGAWWLCQDNMKTKWMKHMTKQLVGNFSFMDQCFYLPMGTPDDDDRDGWAALGIDGWVRVALETNTTMVPVGQSHLREIPWLSKGDFVSAGDVSQNPTAMQRAIEECEVISANNGIQPVLFVFSAGSGAKTMITELMHPSRPTSKDMFVDAGTALDGFAGVHSREFNSGKNFVDKYCNNIMRVDAVNMDSWIKPGICPPNPKP